MMEQLILEFYKKIIIEFLRYKRSVRQNNIKKKIKTVEGF